MNSLFFYLCKNFFNIRTNSLTLYVQTDIMYLGVKDTKTIGGYQKNYSKGEWKNE